MPSTLSLDTILPGIEGKLIALFGDLSTRRNQIMKQFILDGFQNEGTSCIVSMSLSATEIIDELSTYTPEASMVVNEAILNERLQIVDMYSFRGVEKTDDIPGTHMLPSADDLTLLSITLNKILKSHPKCRVTIFPYSLLHIYTPHADLINFTQTVAARLSGRNQVGLLIADRGVIPAEEQLTVETIVDSVVEMKREESDNGMAESFRVKFFRGSDDYQYQQWTNID